MFKKALSIATLLVISQAPAFGGDVSVAVGGANSFNNNSGSISVNQSNTISNRDVAVDEHLNSLLGKAASTLSSPSATPQQKNDATQTTHFAAMAKEINSMQASLQQKNRQCQSKAKVLADIMGFNVGFFFDKCNDVFR